MTIISLGIESSCDETAASIVTSDKEILANIVLSQVAEHQKYQGVVPEIASRSHMNYLDFAIKEALSVASMSLADISCISTTCGPGLIGGVIVGTMFGKAIASVTKKPFIAINHLEGHALTARLTSDIQFPYLLLLASGGHCQFLAVMETGQYILLGKTIDDSAGEAFDKVAKMLGLPYPGGPIIEQRALLGDANKYEFKAPMCDRAGCDMSFSGLKTSVRTLIQTQQNMTDGFINDVCASFQKTILKTFQYKIREAIKQYEAFSSKKQIIISGGVAANQYLVTHLRSSLDQIGYGLYSPPIPLCTDNAAMIAWAGIEKFMLNQFSSLDFCPRARWPLSG